MHGQDLTKGSIPKQMWSLAWPLMLSVFFYTLYSTVDSLWVGRISAEAIAAVSISQITLFVMVGLSMGITAGSGVLMAMNIGAKKIVEAGKILGQSFVLAVIIGIFFTILALVFSEQILSLAGATGAIFPLAQAYYTITAAGLILLFVMMPIIFAFNAQGDTFTLTKLFAISTFTNIVLDPILIFGFGPVPALGIRGAAIATLISQFIFLVASIYTLSRPNMTVQLKFNNLRLNFNSLKKVFAIGFPAALTNALGPLGQATFIAIAAFYFMEAGAVSASIGFRIEFFAFLPAIGYGFGAMAMLGQNIGAKNFERAKAAYQHALKMGFALALGFGVLTFILATPLIMLFTDDPTITQYTKLYIWAIPLSFGFLAALLIEATAFQGIGKSWPGFWILFFKFAVIAIPLSIILTGLLNFSIFGIWISIVIGNVIAATIGFIWFNRTLSKMGKF